MRRHLASLLPRAQGIAASCQQPTKAAVFIASRGFADDANLKKTVLYDFHVAHGGAHPNTTTANTITNLCRENGPIRWLVYAYSIQRLDHGFVQVVPY